MATETTMIKDVLYQHVININNKMHFVSFCPSARQIQTGLQDADFTTKLTTHIILNRFFMEFIAMN